jgi:transposase
MPKVDDLSRSLVAFDQDATLIVVVEMSEASWLVAGMAPGVDRQPLQPHRPSASLPPPPSISFGLSATR